jgi:VIT1/CCC1 family predicted Fe2+/Mn2+ transporter
MRRGYLRNFIFGAEDALVSTVGLLTGIAFAGVGNRTVIISGIVYIIVEAISMSAGAYLSEDSANDLPAEGVRDNQITDAIVMFFSSLLIGIIPVLPYLFPTEGHVSFYWSVAFSLISLFAVGIIKGLVVGRHPIISAIKITVVGGIVIGLAIAVGLLIKI